MRIATTVITGHLGAGKTSAIAHLLSHRPAAERWAVIVNEFGELGVDGAVLERDEDGLLLEEITGACICCGMGSPLVFVLEQLLQKQQFDRLLIEPTGLAEPTAVTDSFVAPTIRDRLQRNALICLVDMRSSAVARWQNHATFQRQVCSADVLVGNFDDEATAAEREQFLQYARELAPPKMKVMATSGGRLDVGLLELQPVTAWSTVEVDDAVDDHGAESCGLELPATDVIDRRKLTELLRQWAPNLLRAKGFVRTPYGFKRFDVDGGGTVRWQTIPSAPQTRMDFIAEVGRVDWEALKSALKACVD